VSINSDHYAVLVGLDGNGDMPAPAHASDDVRAVADWLRSPDGGGVPPSNMTLLLRTRDSRETRSVSEQLQLVFRRYGVRAPVKAASRLYFVFAGPVMGRIDDLHMVLGKAGASPSSMLGLQALRSRLRNSTFFAEAVFIIDGLMVADGDLFGPGLEILGPQDLGNMNCELLVVSRWQAAPDVGAPGAAPGLLRTIVKGLAGEAVGLDGRVTDVSLRDFLLRSDGRWTVETSRFGTDAHDIVFGEISDRPANGTLMVELPHWTAKVNILDSLLRPVSAPTLTRDDFAQVPVVTFELPQGVYQVEVALDGVTEQQVALVQANATAKIKVERWTNLRATSAAPASGTDAPLDQSQRAEHWSRHDTWQIPTQRAPDSRFFLFMRSLQQRSGRRLGSDLRLQNPQDRLIADFSEGVERDDAAGWMAFNVALPSGPYMLKRGRGAQARFQPVYLCPGWTTQVFLVEKDGEESRTATEFSHHLAPPDGGFSAAADTAGAAAAVVENLQEDATSGATLSSRRMKSLLHGEQRNPWLAVLAAYALLRDDTTPERISAATTSDIDPEELLAFLDSVIPDHPDVRALRLRDDRKAPRSFRDPPLLRVGLKRMLGHASRWRDTIVPGSRVAKLLMQGMLADTPWTAWGPRPSRSKAATPERASADPARTDEDSPEVVVPVTSTLAQTLPTKAPVYRFPDEDERRAAESGQRVSRAAKAGRDAAAALQYGPLIQLAGGFIDNPDRASVPKTITLNLAEGARNVLKKLKPSQVSTATGLPLALVSRALKELTADLQASVPAAKPTTSPAVAAAQSALVTSAFTSGAIPGASMSSTPASADLQAATGLGQDVETPSVTIEDCVRRLLQEASRLSSSADSPKLAELAAKLQRSAGELLRHADNVVITDSSGHVNFGNGAFRLLLSPAGPQETAGSRQRAWEQVLAGAPLGISSVENPLPEDGGRAGKRWQLQRIAVKGDAGGGAKAYINLIRSENAATILSEKLSEIDELLPELTLYASFEAQDPNTPPDPTYLEKLERTVMRIEAMAFSAPDPSPPAA
jgi:hypothetical protein